ncbi:hypothetical protein LC607_10990 [Nostoc sp. CHAB 5824]|nr:hypothetical protein [Nostoc sp. CHAB 5824]
MYLLKGKNLKIHEQIQNKLNFTIQPKLLRFIGLFIGQAGIICLYTIFTIISVTQLSCDRVPQNLQASSIEQKSSIIICQRREFDFSGHQKSQKQITGLIGISSETVPLSGCYSSGFQEKQQIVNMIKSFLASN